MKTKVLLFVALVGLLSCGKDDGFTPFCEDVWEEPYFIIEQGDTLSPELIGDFEEVSNVSYKLRFGFGTTQQTQGWNDVCGRRFENGEFIKVQWQSSGSNIMIRAVSDSFIGIPFYEVAQCDPLYINLNIDYIAKQYEVRIALEGNSSVLFPFSFSHEIQDSKEVPVSTELGAQWKMQIYKEITS